MAICDTYNGAVRRYDPPSGETVTLAAGLAEPSAAYVDGPDLVVVESAAHRLTRVPLGAAGRHTDGFATATQRPVTEVTAELDLVVAFVPPPGQRADERYGPASQLVVEATPGALIKGGDGLDAPLTRRLLLDSTVGEGVLHVAARAASCDTADDGSPQEGAACHVHQQDWGIPVRVTPTGEPLLSLPLGGAD